MCVSIYMHSFNHKHIPLHRIETVKESQCSRSQKAVASRGASPQTPLDYINWSNTFCNDADFNLKDKGNVFLPLSWSFRLNPDCFHVRWPITVIRVQFRTMNQCQDEQGSWQGSLINAPSLFGDTSISSVPYQSFFFFFWDYFYTTHANNDHGFFFPVSNRTQNETNDACRKYKQLLKKKKKGNQIHEFCFYQKIRIIIFIILFLHIKGMLRKNVHVLVTEPRHVWCVKFAHASEIWFCSRSRWGRTLSQFIPGTLGVKQWREYGFLYGYELFCSNATFFLADFRIGYWCIRIIIFIMYLFNCTVVLTQ